ncbi:MAG: VIT1/CCC1 transporter family protein [Proteobacteria bacterium]|nr:VIT1/CCC1 transporter family protein [Pseudomonadota bacterium]
MEKRVLDPIDRISEFLFGLFMVLSFTGALSVASTGPKEVHEMLVAAIGCNIAWGFVDGVMFVLRNLVSRARQHRLWNMVVAEKQPEAAHGLIAQEIGGLAASFDKPVLERTRQWILAQPGGTVPPARLVGRDLTSAVAVFLMVFASTFPPVLPFVFFDDIHRAMRVSALVAIAMMFVCGWQWARFAGLRPWRAGMIMVVLGVAVEATIIALGG